MRLLMHPDDVTADRAGWLKLRLGDEESGARIGASDIGKILGAEGARGSAYGLWAEKTGQLAPDDEPSEVVEFGTYCEPFSAWLLARDKPGWHITPGGMYCHDDRPWMTATFDRLMHDAEAVPCPAAPADLLHPAPPAAPVQLKNSAFTDWVKDGPPQAYVAQVLWEAAVMGADRGYLVAFDRNAVKIAILTIEMDARAAHSVEVMIGAAERFRDQVARQVPPDVDGHPATTAALKEISGPVDRDAVAVLPRRLAARWMAAVAADAATEQRRRLYLNRLLARAGNARTWAVREPDGTLATVATRSAGDRAGHWVKAAENVDTIRPRRSWDGWRPRTPAASEEPS